MMIIFNFNGVSNRPHVEEVDYRGTTAPNKLSFWVSLFLELFLQSETTLFNPVFFSFSFFLYILLRPNCIARIAWYDRVTSRIRSSVGQMHSLTHGASTQCITRKRVIDFYVFIPGNRKNIFFIRGGNFFLSLLLQIRPSNINLNISMLIREIKGVPRGGGQTFSFLYYQRQDVQTLILKFPYKTKKFKKLFFAMGVPRGEGKIFIFFVIRYRTFKHK